VARPEPRGQRTVGGIRPGTAVRRDDAGRHDDHLGGRTRRRLPIIHEPQRHADELHGRSHAVGELDHLRGDGQRPRRRCRLHGCSEHGAAAAARLHLRGAGGWAVESPADQERGTLRPRGRRVRPERRNPLPDRGQLRVPVRLLPVHPAEQPDGDPPLGRRWPPPDARSSGHTAGGPGQSAAAASHVPRDVGRHRGA
jgi:hypothetical protein